MRLIAPNGSVVNVSDEKGERLMAQGFKKPAASRKPQKKTESTDSED